MTSRARVVSVAFALCGFAAALVSGLGAGNAPGAVLLRAMLALLACQALGMAVGLMLEKLIDEQEARYRAAHPIPEAPVVVPARDEGVIEVDEVVEEQGTSRAAP